MQVFIQGIYQFSQQGAAVYEHILDQFYRILEVLKGMKCKPIKANISTDKHRMMDVKDCPCLQRILQSSPSSAKPQRVQLFSHKS